MLTAHVDELLWSLAIAVLYLLAIRLLDLNEREPLWSVTVLFVLGGAAGTLLRLTIDSTVLDLTVLRSAIFKESATFLAIAAGMWILAGIGRFRGWNEVSDLVDGLVYGMAAGLGFSSGETLARWLGATPSVSLSALTTPFGLATGAALAGLKHGVFGGIIGAGFGAGIGLRARVSQVALVAVALMIAIAMDAGHQVLAYGNALGGSSAALRAWMALTLPVLAVAGIGLYGLMTGRRAIRRYLADEVGSDIVSEADLAMLNSSIRRQLEYAGALATLRFRQLSSLTALHNRQVMLALAKSRSALESDLHRRAAIDSEVERLREKVRESQRRLGRNTAGSAPVGVKAGRSDTRPPEVK